MPQDLHTKIQIRNFYLQASRSGSLIEHGWKAQACLCPSRPEETTGQDHLLFVSDLSC
ncbi:mCG147367 [Mus musculus]|nr:mCG147367 [Mus musculus]